MAADNCHSNSQNKQYHIRNGTQNRGKGNVNTILFYSILYYTILYYTILYYTILYYIILSYPILSYPILSYPILSYTILFYSILQCKKYSEYNIQKARLHCGINIPCLFGSTTHKEIIYSILYIHIEHTHSVYTHHKYCTVYCIQTVFIIPYYTY